jgi:hypothetical protein
VLEISVTCAEACAVAVAATLDTDPNRPEKLPEPPREAITGTVVSRVVCVDVDDVRLVLTATKAAVLAVVLACADTVADTEQDPEILAV